MLKVAILDDYQNVAQDFVNLKKLSGKYQIEIFNEPFENEDDAIEQLKDFDALLVMRERTKITNKASNFFNFSIASSSFSNGSLNISI